MGKEKVCGINEAPDNEGRVSQADCNSARAPKPKMKEKKTARRKGGIRLDAKEVIGISVSELG